jgi:glucosamine--fructose-6-phosphate aminotransferase (isomerizing)
MGQFMRNTPLHQEIDSLPELVVDMIDGLVSAVSDTFSQAFARKLQRVFIFGCGDSHHAALAAELAFEQLAGLPCEPMTAMQFGRYAAGYLPETGAGSNLAVGISVSGQVSRTVEALAMARRGGATAIGVTGNPGSPLAEMADKILNTTVPALATDPPDAAVPGARSYIASQLVLYLSAIHLGQERGHLTSAKANELRRELAGAAGWMEQTIAAVDPIAQATVGSWADAEQFLFCGAGPNYATALNSAAKMLEASGDPATGQEMEEWSHLEYFARHPATPMFLISAGGVDESRTLEVAEAAIAIGRRVATIAPAGSALAQSRHTGVLFPLAGSIRECFSPLLTVVPGMLFSAYRAQLLGESYFRDFGGGRSREGGGGISRIRDSHRLDLE